MTVRGMSFSAPEPHGQNDRQHLTNLHPGQNSSFAGPIIVGLDARTRHRRQSQKTSKSARRDLKARMRPVKKDVLARRVLACVKSDFSVSCK